MIRLLAILLSAALMLGCGGGEESVEESGDIAEVEQALSELAVDGSGALRACSALTDDFLAESYLPAASNAQRPEGPTDAALVEARERCRRDAARNPAAGLTSYEVIEVTGDCARAEAVDQNNVEFLLLMRKQGGRWLIDEISESPPHSDCSAPDDKLLP